MVEMLADLESWLMGRCSYLSHGQCYSHKCLIRGGYRGEENIDPKRSTCEPKELYDMLRELRKELR